MTHFLYALLPNGALRYPRVEVLPTQAAPTQTRAPSHQVREDDRWHLTIRTVDELTAMTKLP
ncbi:hypothetical protein [Muriicola sp. Z0-33]|uniref:hypothetical protein n=1 Tax=Muriicola sp. Z0-33 TaxID=2816957 RepID=UPI00223721BE|nr:hypothetical protein [Muriicola sp. Z0-33]MCW5517536.1 hypothetical protein [Muriicola sp. Z0-33]